MDDSSGSIPATPVGDLDWALTLAWPALAVAGSSESETVEEKALSVCLCLSLSFSVCMSLPFKEIKFNKDVKWQFLCHSHTL